MLLHLSFFGTALFAQSGKLGVKLCNERIDQVFIAAQHALEAGDRYSPGSSRCSSVGNVTELGQINISGKDFG